MPRAGLTPELVTAAAADIADESGWEQLTLAAVAARFGVRQPSLYKHVESLARLRRNVAVLACGELQDRLSDATVGRSGQDALQAMAGAYRSYAHEHPGRYAACVAAPAAGDAAHERAAQRVLTTVAATLTEYDLTGDDQIHAIRALRAAMHGFVSLEAAGGFALPQDTDVSYRRLVDDIASGLRDVARR